MVIRNIRVENVALFVGTVDTMLSRAFALDHINYPRWISVFICDLKSLYGKDVYNEFCKGHFTVKKSNRAFFSIGEDHAHEQNNKIMKGDSGAIGIFDHEEALLEWAVCGLAIANTFQDLPDLDEDDRNQFHHENTDYFEKTFQNDSNKIFEEFLNNGNLFAVCEQDLVDVVSKTVVNK